MISDGPFRIAERTGALVLPTFVVRQRAGTHRLVIEDPIAIESDQDGESRKAGMARFLETFEAYVKRYPCHYAFRMARDRILSLRGHVPLFADHISDAALTNIEEL